MTDLSSKQLNAYYSSHKICDVVQSRSYAISKIQLPALHSISTAAKSRDNEEGELATASNVSSLNQHNNINTDTSVQISQRLNDFIQYTSKLPQPKDRKTVNPISPDSFSLPLAYAGLCQSLLHRQDSDKVKTNVSGDKASFGFTSGTFPHITREDDNNMDMFSKTFLTRPRMVSAFPSSLAQYSNDVLYSGALARGVENILQIRTPNSPQNDSSKEMATESKEGSSATLTSTVSSASSSSWLQNIPFGFSPISSDVLTATILLGDYLEAKKSLETYREEISTKPFSFSSPFPTVERDRGENENQDQQCVGVDMITPGKQEKRGRKKALESSNEQEVKGTKIVPKVPKAPKAPKVTKGTKLQGKVESITDDSTSTTIPKTTPKTKATKVKERETKPSKGIVPEERKSGGRITRSTAGTKNMAVIDYDDENENDNEKESVEERYVEASLGLVERYGKDGTLPGEAMVISSVSSPLAETIAETITAFEDIKNAEYDPRDKVNEIRTVIIEEKEPVSVEDVDVERGKTKDVVEDAAMRAEDSVEIKQNHAAGVLDSHGATLQSPKTDALVSPTPHSDIPLEVLTATSDVAMTTLETPVEDAKPVQIGDTPTSDLQPVKLSKEELKKYRAEKAEEKKKEKKEAKLAELRARAAVDPSSLTKAESRQLRYHDIILPKTTSAAAVGRTLAASAKALSSRAPPCIFYLQGTCRKGDSCPFSHVGEVVKKKELCQYFLNGKCNKGDACAFSHDVSHVPCRFYHDLFPDADWRQPPRRTSYCRLGTSCPFSHEPITPLERRQLIEEASLRTSAKRKLEVYSTGIAGTTGSMDVGENEKRDAITQVKRQKAQLQQKREAIESFSRLDLFGEEQSNGNIVRMENEVVVSAGGSRVEDSDARTDYIGKKENTMKTTGIVKATKATKATTTTSTTAHSVPIKSHKANGIEVAEAARSFSLDDLGFGIDFSAISQPTPDLTKPDRDSLVVENTSESAKEKKQENTTASVGMDTVDYGEDAYEENSIWDD